MESERTNSEPADSHAAEEPSFLDTPQGRKLAYHRLHGEVPGVVYIHGLNSTMGGEKCAAVENFCRTTGRAFLRFDLSGHGRSSGTLRECTVTAWLEDVSAVLENLTEGPQILIGSSLGGWLMFLYTLRNPDIIRGLIGLSTAADFTQHIWKGLEKEKRVNVQRSGVYEMPSPYCPDPIPISMELIQDGDKYSILEMPGIEYIKVPTWLIHGDLDTVVPPSTSLQLLQRLECPVELRTVEDGDHRLSRPQDIHLLEQALTALLNPDSEAAKLAREDED
jgi:pimeloyl-ACP methyl ester carboxylesterase